MKKLISLFLILSLIFCFAACGGNETEGENSGNNITNNSNILDNIDNDYAEQFLCDEIYDGAITIKGYNGIEESVVIPEEIMGKPVKHIVMIETETPIKEITISKNVQYLDYSAFNALDSLETINVDENNPYFFSVNGVLFNKVNNNLVFYPIAKNAKEYVIPDGVTELCYNTFYKTKYIETLIVSEGVKLIAQDSICNCENLKEIKLSSTVNIEHNDTYYDLFNSNPNLKTITLNENNPYLSIIDGILFNKEQTLLISCPPKNELKNSKFVIPDTVETIGASAFESCVSLEEIILPNNLKSIESRAFSNSSIKKIDIPDSVTFIDTAVFCGCKALKNVTLPNNITSIPWIFKDCESLENITLPDTITSIESYAFSGCKSLKNIIIPNNVTVLSSFVFESCASLTSITIPSSVKKIEIGAFEYDENLKQINYLGKAEEWKKIEIESCNEPVFNSIINCIDGQLISSDS